MQVRGTVPIPEGEIVVSEVIQRNQEPVYTASCTPKLVETLDRIASSLEAIQASHERIAEYVAPESDAIVGTPYISKRLGCTTIWITEMVRTGKLPKSCIVPGTGNGKPWKFDRKKI